MIHIGSKQQICKNNFFLTTETNDALVKAIGEIKRDYEDFKRRTSTLWSVQASVMSVLEQVDINKDELSNKITNMSKDLTGVVKYAVRPLHSALLSVVEEMSLCNKRSRLLSVFKRTIFPPQFREREGGEREIN